MAGSQDSQFSPKADAEEYVQVGKVGLPALSQGSPELEEGCKASLRPIHADYLGGLHSINNVFGVMRGVDIVDPATPPPI